MRECSRCAATKPLAEFPKNSKCNNGRTRVCNECTNARARKWRKRAAAERPEFVEARRLSQAKERARRYGLTLEALYDLERTANGACALCGRSPSGRGPADQRLHVDHCHETGRVRGMLCADCNRGIGLFQDDPELMRRAAAYIEC